jgi:hypothetical protein
MKEIISADGRVEFAPDPRDQFVRGMNEATCGYAFDRGPGGRREGIPYTPEEEADLKTYYDMVNKTWRTMRVDGYLVPPGATKSDYDHMPMKLSRLVAVNVTISPELRESRASMNQPLVWTLRGTRYYASDACSTFMLKRQGGYWKLWISGHKTNAGYPELWYAKWGIDRLRGIDFREVRP